MGGTESSSGDSETTERLSSDESKIGLGSCENTRCYWEGYTDQRNAAGMTFLDSFAYPNASIEDANADYNVLSSSNCNFNIGTPCYDKGAMDGFCDNAKDLNIYPAKCLGEDSNDIYMGNPKEKK